MRAAWTSIHSKKPGSAVLALGTASGRPHKLRVTQNASRAYRPTTTRSTGRTRDRVVIARISQVRCGNTGSAVIVIAEEPIEAPGAAPPRSGPNPPGVVSPAEIR